MDGALSLWLVDSVHAVIPENGDGRHIVCGDCSFRIVSSNIAIHPIACERTEASRSDMELETHIAAMVVALCLDVFQRSVVRGQCDDPGWHNTVPTSLGGVIRRPLLTGLVGTL